MMLVILLFAAVIAAVKSAPTGNDHCIENYLKQKELLSSEFGNDDEVTPTCESIVESIKESILKQLQDAFNEEEDMKNQTACMIESMQATTYVDEMLLLYVYEKDNEAATNDEKEEMKAEIMHNAHVFTIHALLKCKSSEMFGELFDSIFEEDSSSSEEDDLTDSEDYCVRKHVIENNLIDTAKYQLDENPKKINVSELDCSAIYKSVVEKIETKIIDEVPVLGSEESSESKDDVDSDSECLLQVIRTGEFVDKLTPFEFLKEFSMTDEQKGEEKQKFIDIMSEMTEKFATECLT
jgi:hypothetical protein